MANSGAQLQNPSGELTSVIGEISSTRKTLFIAGTLYVVWAFTQYMIEPETANSILERIAVVGTFLGLFTFSYFPEKFVLHVGARGGLRSWSQRVPWLRISIWPRDVFDRLLHNTCAAIEAHRVVEIERALVQINVSKLRRRHGHSRSEGQCSNVKRHSLGDASNG